MGKRTGRQGSRGRARAHADEITGLPLDALQAIEITRSLDDAELDEVLRARIPPSPPGVARKRRGQPGAPEPSPRTADHLPRGMEGWEESDFLLRMFQIRGWSTLTLRMRHVEDPDAPEVKVGDALAFLAKWATRIARRRREN